MEFQNPEILQNDKIFYSGLNSPEITKDVGNMSSSLSEPSSQNLD